MVREVYTMSPAQMPEWRAICKAFAEKIEAELLFVNEQSCGVQYKDGTFGHIYIDEMEAFLKENDLSKTEMPTISKADMQKAMGTVSKDNKMLE